VRIPNSYTFAKALVRLYHDGEPRTFELRKRKATIMNPGGKFLL